MNKLRHTLGAALIWSLMAAVTGFAQAVFHDQPLVVETSQQNIEFRIEIADEPDERSQGLMFRRSMAEDAGMLFAYEAPREITMWMKNTYISLDMVFVDAQGEVVSIARDTIPHSLEVVSSRADAQYVLELNAGTAKRLGIGVGDRVQHPAIQ